MPGSTFAVQVLSFGFGWGRHPVVFDFWGGPDVVRTRRQGPRGDHKRFPCHFCVFTCMRGPQVVIARVLTPSAARAIETYDTCALYIELFLCHPSSVHLPPFVPHTSFSAGIAVPQARLALRSYPTCTRPPATRVQLPIPSVTSHAPAFPDAVLSQLWPGPPAQRLIKRPPGPIPAHTSFFPTLLIY